MPDQQTQTAQEQMDEIRALTEELDQNVRTLKRLLAEDQEQGDKKTEESPEDLLKTIQGN